MQTSWCNYMYKNVKPGSIRLGLGFSCGSCSCCPIQICRFLVLKVRHKVLQGNFGIWNICIINIVCFIYSVWKTSLEQNVKQLRPPVFWPRPPFHTPFLALNDVLFVHFFHTCTHTHTFYTLVFSRLLEFFKRYIKESKLHYYIAGARTHW